MSNFKVSVSRTNGNATVTYTIDTPYRVFNGGEVNIRLPLRKTRGVVDTLSVLAKLETSDDVMALCMLTDALRRFSPTAHLVLTLLYVPYARQDRVCNAGEALSIKVFAGILNSLKYNEVKIADPHSEVTPALINNLTKVYTQESIILHSTKLDEDLRSGTILISPDAGATKKTEMVSKRFGGTPVVQGFKHRNLKTGALSGFGVSDPSNLIKGADCLIVDDICDGGGTFVGLAKVLLDKGAATVRLYVTHGIFSKGVGFLLDNGIDHVYTTDSFGTNVNSNGLTVIDFL